MPGIGKGTIDMVMSRDNGAVTLTTSSDRAQFITVGAKSYIKATAHFWSSLKEPAKTVKFLAGKWVALPAAADTKFFTLSGFADGVEHPASGAQYAAKTSALTYQGKPVVVLKQADGSVVYISATGSPLPVFWHDATADTGGDFTFSDYGNKTTISAPAGAIDLSGAATS